MLKKIILLIGCALVFGCGSSDDKNAGAAAGSVAGVAGTSSWGVPNSNTSSWGIPSTGVSSWGVSTGAGAEGTGAAGAGGGDSAGVVCETEQFGTTKCPTIKVCGSASGGYFEAAGATFRFQDNASGQAAMQQVIAACQ